jgi:hypothetical protein
VTFIGLRIRRDERGASLVLAIVFMVVAGAIGAFLTSTVTSGINDSSVLATARNREYAADGAIEEAITLTRTNGGVCPATIPPWTLDGFTIRVDCNNSPAVAVATDPLGNVSVVAQHDVVFSACDNASGEVCSDANQNVVIRARINYSFTGIPPKLTTTYVQAWSVNG